METNELGRAKKTRRAYGFDEISLAPSIVTINPDDTDLSVRIGKYKFDVPIIASAMDGVVSPKLAVQMSKLGGLGVLNLQGVWARYEDADKILQQISSVSREEYVPLMQKLYLEPIKKDLIIKRIKEIKDAGGERVGTQQAQVTWQRLFTITIDPGTHPMPLTVSIRKQ